MFLASFFYASEGYLRQWQVQAGGFARHSLCWCFGVARPAFWKPFRGLWGLFLASFSTRQKVTLGSGRFRLGASLVTASAGVSAWRGRLFGSLFEACGACFWLLFSTRQKVTLGSGFRLVFFYPSEGYLRHWRVQAGGFARHSLCWCFDLARPAFWKPFGGLWGLFLASFFYPSEGYLRHYLLFFSTRDRPRL